MLPGPWCSPGSEAPVQGAHAKHSCTNNCSVSRQLMADRNLFSGALDELLKDVDSGSGSCL